MHFGDVSKTNGKEKLAVTTWHENRWPRVTIQMKTTEQYFPVVLFTMPYKVVLTFGSVDEILSVIIQMNAPEQYFPVILFVILY